VLPIVAEVTKEGTSLVVPSIVVSIHPTKVLPKISFGSSGKVMEAFSAKSCVVVIPFTEKVAVCFSA
jgi:hypothetical protein